MSDIKSLWPDKEYDTTYKGDKMRLILSRHGNTFSSNDTPVYVGATEDLPLVDAGREQAQRFAAYLKDRQIKPHAIYCSPLLRATEYADIVVQELGLSMTPVVDDALTEIDYGNWAGKTTDQIVAEYGEEAVRNWRERGVWPINAGWKPAEQELINRVEEFSQRMVENHSSDETAIAISSNGVIRYFLTLVHGAFEKHQDRNTLHVRTGNICQLHFESGLFKKSFWNRDPANVLEMA